MSYKGLTLAKAGEEDAAGLLKQNGYRIIARNYKTRLGEIDIVAFDGDAVCFVEVKTRSSRRFGLPQEAVSGIKQRQIAKAALCFIKEKNFFNRRARFDVVSVDHSCRPAKLELIKNAFELNENFSP